MDSLVAFGIFMGIAFAAPPGIVTAETFRRGVARGFPAALSVQLGSLIGDAVYCLLALAGVAVLVQNPITQRALGIVSVVLLMYLAVTGILSELRAPKEERTRARSEWSGAETERSGKRSLQERGTGGESAQVHKKNAFFTGLLLSLTNPWAIGFWLALGGTLASYGAMESGGTMALFFASFFGACIVYSVAMALFIGVAHKRMSPRVGKWISVACSAVIGFLGIGVAVQVLQLFLNG